MAWSELLIIGAGAVVVLAVVLILVSRRGSGVREIGAQRTAGGTTMRPTTAPAPAAAMPSPGAAIAPPADMGRLTLEERSAIAWLQDQLRSEIHQDLGVDISHDQMAQQRILEAIVKALIELRTAEVTYIELPYIAADATGAKNFRRELTRIEAEAAQE